MSTDSNDGRTHFVGDGCGEHLDLDVAELRAQLAAVTEERDSALANMFDQMNQCEQHRAQAFTMTLRMQGNRDAAVAKLDASERAGAAMREALRFQDPRNATARYDRIADEFYSSTGLWPPGRSRAAEMGVDHREEEAHREWRKFVDKWHEDWFDAALAPNAGRSFVPRAAVEESGAAMLQAVNRLAHVGESSHAKDLNDARNKLCAALQSGEEESMRLCECTESPCKHEGT